MYNITMYPLQIRMEQIIELPRNSRIVSVVNQKEYPCLYAVVDVTTSQKEQYSILCFGTGDCVDIAQGYNFGGTTVFMGGGYIYHWFYKKL